MEPCELRLRLTGIPGRLEVVLDKSGEFHRQEEEHEVSGGLRCPRCRFVALQA